MIPWLIVLLLAWLGCLGFFSFRSLKKNRDDQDYVFAGANLGALLGMLTFAATLFSTFTLMGMPDFFRVHGVGAWIFLGISDAGAFFFILWFAHKLRQNRAGGDFKGMSNLLSGAYRSRFAGWLYFGIVFIFLIPYVAIQIRGIAIFLNAIFPEALPAWGWSLAIVTVMLIYSEIGGLRAIIYSDALQAIVLLVAIWIIALFCLEHVGGMTALFDRLKAEAPEVLSTPGPKGLMTFQFLIGSLFAITMIPVTQPQVITRLIIMRSTAKMHRMVVSLGVFAFLVILPTAFIGLYGTLHYAGVPTSEFLSQVLLFENPDPVAALVVVGLLAAAISTADSQIFALGTEFRSLLPAKWQSELKVMRGFVMFFGLCALIFSIVSGDQLVLLARVSFMGTALAGPLILAALFSTKRLGLLPVIITLVIELVFLSTLLGGLPNTWGGLRADLALFLGGAFSIGLVTLLRPAGKA